MLLQCLCSYADNIALVFLNNYYYTKEAKKLSGRLDEERTMIHRAPTGTLNDEMSKAHYVLCIQSSVTELLNDDKLSVLKLSNLGAV